MGELPRLAVWQARAFSRDLRWRWLWVALWVPFWVDGLYRWGSGSIWTNGGAVASATGQRMRPGRLVVMVVGCLAVVLVLAIAAAVWPVVTGTVACVALGVVVVGAVVQAMTVQDRAGVRHARKALRGYRRARGGAVGEVVNVARADGGGSGAGRELMGECAEQLCARGVAVVCIARSSWHLGYYQRGGWEQVAGLMCRYP